jgi:type IV fimbrial biogenesis protein FimT
VNYGYRLKSCSLPSGRERGAAQNGFGFTLVELVVTLTVLGILTGIAVPQFTDFLRNSRRAATINELVASLTLARSEAVRRGAQVVVCKAVDDTACLSGAGDTWQAGWLVFVNTDADSPPVVDPDETVLKVRTDQAGVYQVRPSAAVDDFIVFGADGSALQDGSFTYCDTRGAPRARAVVVSPVGRIRLSVDTNADGVEEDDDGALSCS